MTRWLIRTEDKKCAWSVDTWERDGVEISLTTLYRWGSVIVEQDVAPEFDPQYVVNITEEFPQYEMNDLEDTVSEDWDFDEVDDEHTGAEIEAGWAEGGNDWMDANGWTNTSFAVYFAGEISVTEYTG